MIRPVSLSRQTTRACCTIETSFLAFDNAPLEGAAIAVDVATAAIVAAANIFIFKKPFISYLALLVYRNAS
jgi:hypothetical protein